MANKVVSTGYSWAWAAKLDNDRLQQEVLSHASEIANALAKELFTLKPSKELIQTAERVLPQFKHHAVPRVVAEKFERSVSHRLITPMNELSLACKQNQTQTALELIQEGAPIAVADTEGKTPLSWASSHCNEELVLALFARGAKFSATLPSLGWLNEVICRKRLDQRLQEMVRSQIDLDQLPLPDGTFAKPLLHFFKNKGNIFDILRFIDPALLLPQVTNILELPPERYPHIPPVALAILMMSDLRELLFQQLDLDFLRDEKMIACAQITSKVFSEDEMIAFLNKLNAARQIEFVKAIEGQSELEGIREAYCQAHPELEGTYMGLLELSEELNKLFRIMPRHILPTMATPCTELLKIFRNTSLPLRYRLVALYFFRQKADLVDRPTLREFYQFSLTCKEQLQRLWERSIRAPSDAALLGCWLDADRTVEIPEVIIPIKEFLTELTRLKSISESTTTALNSQLNPPVPNTNEQNSEAMRQLYDDFASKFEQLKQHLLQITSSEELPEALDAEETYRLYFSDFQKGTDVQQHISAKRKELEIETFDHLVAALDRQAKRRRTNGKGGSI